MSAQAGKPLRLEHDTVESSNGWFHRVFLVPDGTSALKGDDDFGVLEIHQENRVAGEEMYLVLERARFAVESANVFDESAALHAALTALPEDSPNRCLQRVRTEIVDRLEMPARAPQGQ
jgi:hypothetical protein